MKEQIAENALAEDADVVLKVSANKAELIKEQIIDEQRYVLIPIADDEHILVNGKQI